jgi:hypothetical protein
MTRLILAAGVAALAITAPAASQPRERAKDRATEVQKQRGEARAQRTERRAQAQKQRAQRVERVQTRVADRPARVERQQARANRVERVQTRVADRPARIERQQVRPSRVDAQQMRADRQALQAERQQMRGDRQARTQVLQADRQQMRGDRQARTQALQADRQNMRAERVQLRADRVAEIRRLAANKAAIRPLNAFGTRVLPVTTARTLVGVPVATAATVAALSPLPTTVQYLYPNTPDYYYRYGDGYLYQVDRSSNLISALLPLLAGGFLPGQYLPNNYMNSYVPNQYGFNNFYPSSSNDCYRYGEGVVFRVDCFTGLIEEVIPLYAGGYGVGQMLPSSYGYYNVPSQYRSLYYDTSDYGYRYAPGAIYQYDPRSSMITSVAALLTPGFTVGQPLPLGYSTYNVPYAYRSSYYDRPDAWYRYNNGYIYQVDPTTQIVSAIVASALT